MIRNLWQLNDDQQFIKRKTFVSSSESSCNNCFWISRQRNIRWFLTMKEKENSMILSKQEKALWSFMFDKLAKNNSSVTIIRNNWFLKSFFFKHSFVNNQQCFSFRRFLNKNKHDLKFYDNFYDSFFINAQNLNVFKIVFKFLFLTIFTHLIELRWLIMIVFLTSISKWDKTNKHLKQIIFEIFFVTIAFSQYCCQWRVFFSKFQLIFYFCLMNFSSLL
jgi:hypothetical protein